MGILVRQGKRSKTPTEYCLDSKCTPDCNNVKISHVHSKGEPMQKPEVLGIYAKGNMVLSGKFPINISHVQKLLT